MRSHVMVVLVGFLVGWPALISASDSPAERASLKGLTAINVVVEDPGPAAEKSGLTPVALQNAVQLRLRQSGVPVTPDADPYLYVQVTVIDPGASLPLAYAINVAFMQEITLPRGLGTYLQSPTWSLTSLGMVGSDRFAKVVQDRVQEFVNQFAGAYLSVNPKS
jgi:hypothetical protein